MSFNSRFNYSSPSTTNPNYHAPVEEPTSSIQEEDSDSESSSVDFDSERLTPEASPSTPELKEDISTRTSSGPSLTDSTITAVAKKSLPEEEKKSTTDADQAGYFSWFKDKVFSASGGLSSLVGKVSEYALAGGKKFLVGSKHSYDFASKKSKLAYDFGSILANGGTLDKEKFNVEEKCEASKKKIIEAFKYKKNPSKGESIISLANCIIDILKSPVKALVRDQMSKSIFLKAVGMRVDFESLSEDLLQVNILHLFANLSASAAETSEDVWIAKYAGRASVYHSREPLENIINSINYQLELNEIDYRKDDAMEVVAKELLKIAFPGGAKDLILPSVLTDHYDPRSEIYEIVETELTRFLSEMQVDEEKERGWRQKLQENMGVDFSSIIEAIPVSMIKFFSFNSDSDIYAKKMLAQCTSPVSIAKKNTVYESGLHTMMSAQKGLDINLLAYSLTSSEDKVTLDVQDPDVLGRIFNTTESAILYDALQSIFRSNDETTIKLGKYLSRYMGSVFLGLLAKLSDLVKSDEDKKDFSHVVSQIVSELGSSSSDKCEQFWSTLTEGLPIPSLFEDHQVGALVLQAYDYCLSFESTSSALDQMNKLLITNHLKVKIDEETKQPVTKLKPSIDEISRLLEAMVSDYIESSLKDPKSPIANEITGLFNRYFPGLKPNSDLTGWIQNNVFIPEIFKDALRVIIMNAMCEGFGLEVSHNQREAHQTYFIKMIWNGISDVLTEELPLAKDLKELLKLSADLRKSRKEKETWFEDLNVDDSEILGDLVRAHTHTLELGDHLTAMLSQLEESLSPDQYKLVETFLNLEKKEEAGKDFLSKLSNAHLQIVESVIYTKQALANAEKYKAALLAKEEIGSSFSNTTASLQLFDSLNQCHELEKKLDNESGFFKEMSSAIFEKLGLKKGSQLASLKNLSGKYGDIPKHPLNAFPTAFKDFAWTLIENLQEQSFPSFLLDNCAPLFLLWSEKEQNIQELKRLCGNSDVVTKLCEALAQDVTKRIFTEESVASIATFIGDVLDASKESNVREMIEEEIVDLGVKQELIVQREYLKEFIKTALVKLCLEKMNKNEGHLDLLFLVSARNSLNKKDGDLLSFLGINSPLDLEKLGVPQLLQPVIFKSLNELIGQTREEISCIQNDTDAVIKAKEMLRENYGENSIKAIENLGTFIVEIAAVTLAENAGDSPKGATIIFKALQDKVFEMVQQGNTFSKILAPWLKSNESLVKERLGDLLQKLAKRSDSKDVREDLAAWMSNSFLPPLSQALSELKKLETRFTTVLTEKLVIGWGKAVSKHFEVVSAVKASGKDLNFETFLAAAKDKEIALQDAFPTASLDTYYEEVRRKISANLGHELTDGEKALLLEKIKELGEQDKNFAKILTKDVFLEGLNSVREVSNFTAKTQESIQLESFSEECIKLNRKAAGRHASDENEHCYKDISHRLMDAFYPNGKESLLIPESMKEGVWDTIRDQLLPISLSSIIDTLSDPDTMKLMLLNGLNAANSATSNPEAAKQDLQLDHSGNAEMNEMINSFINQAFETWGLYEPIKIVGNFLIYVADLIFKYILREKKSVREQLVSNLNVTIRNHFNEAFISDSLKKAFELCALGDPENNPLVKQRDLKSESEQTKEIKKIQEDLKQSLGRANSNAVSAIYYWPVQFAKNRAHEKWQELRPENKVIGFIMDLVEVLFNILVVKPMDAILSILLFPAKSLTASHTFAKGLKNQSFSDPIVNRHLWLSILKATSNTLVEISGE